MAIENVGQSSRIAAAFCGYVFSIKVDRRMAHSDIQQLHQVRADFQRSKQIIGLLARSVRRAAAQTQAGIETADALNHPGTKKNRK